MKKMFQAFAKSFFALALVVGMGGTIFQATAKTPVELTAKQKEVVQLLVDRNELDLTTVGGDINNVTWDMVEDAAVVVTMSSVNDIHGAVAGSSSNPGVSKFATAVKRFKANNKNAYFFGSGDLYQGSAISNLTKGKVMNDVFQELDMMYSAIGNHEFDWGANEIPQFQTDGGFKFLSANMTYLDGTFPTWAEPTAMIEVEGVKIGIIGLMTPATKYQTAEENIKDFTFIDPIETAQKWEAKLREEGASAVIVLSHLGSIQEPIAGYTDEGSELAAAVPTLDGVFTAHYHMGVNKTVDGVPVVQGFYNGRGLSKITVVVSKVDNKVIAKYGEVENLRDQINPSPGSGLTALTPDPAIDAIVAGHEAALESVLNEKVVPNTRVYDHTTSPTNKVTEMGQLSAKMMTDIGQTDIAIINGGGIRRGLEASDVTMGDMYEIFPFDNTLVTLDLTGEVLKEAIEHGITADGFKPGQFYGLNVYYEMDENNVAHVSDMFLLDGTKIAMDQTYRISTLDFLLTGGDKYAMFDKGTNVVDMMTPLRDEIVTWMKTQEQLDFVPVQNIFVGTAPQPEEKLIIAEVFKDVNLASVVETLIGAPEATLAELAAITDITQTSKEVKSLVGLEKLTGLINLEIKGSKDLRDLTVIEDISTLKRVGIMEAGFTNTDFAKNWTQLEVLGLPFNEINDLSGLKDLTNLKYLLLAYNNITDVSPLAGLVDVEVVLTGNFISDISPLKTVADYNASDQIIIIPKQNFKAGADHYFENIILDIDGNGVAPTSISHGGVYKDGKIIYKNLKITNAPAFTFNLGGAPAIELPSDASLDELGKNINELLKEGNTDSTTRAMAGSGYYSGMAVAIFTPTSTIPGVPTKPTLPATGEPVAITLVGSIVLMAVSSLLVYKRRKA